MVLAAPTEEGARDRATRTFHDRAIRARVPDPALRAALASLTGTFAEPAIDSVRGRATGGGGAGRQIAFDDDGLVGDGEIARVVEDRILIHAGLRGEDPLLLAPTLAHEVLHADTIVGSYEEAAARALDTLLTLELLARVPDLVTGRTRLARHRATTAVARLNSGVGSSLRIFLDDASGDVLPGSRSQAKSWWETLERGAERATPGSATLGAYLERLGARECDAARFDLALLRCLDRSAVGPGPDVLLRAARALRLDVPPPPPSG